MKTSERSINFHERKGAEDEYLVTKEHLDFILDAVRHMPDPGGLIQPLGWALMGVAATSGVEAYNSTAGTSHRHIYVVIVIAAFIAGFICLFCDRKLNKELGKRSKWLERYMLDIYGAFGIEPPDPEAGRWVRWWSHLSKAPKRREASRT